MSYPVGFESAFSAVGSLRSEIQSELHRKADRYEVDEASRNVDSVAHSVREFGSKVDELCYRLDELSARLEQLEQRMTIREEEA